MARRKWTSQQSAAINTRDKTLLVSAAAGSGKTATLTERIIRTLLDTEDKTSISELLVVTFTNAAAGEMRTRITDSLKAACRENPDNKHLQRQLMLLPSAKIRTIDSFCSDLLRQNTDKVGISPNYRILDAAEGDLLAFSILEALIDAIYGKDALDVASPEEFESLADCLTSAKNMQSLAEVLYDLYERISSETDPFERLEEYRAAVNPASLLEKRNPFIDFYIKRLGEICSFAAASIEKMIGELKYGSDSERAYIDTLRADLDIISDMSAMSDYGRIRETLSSVKWCSVPRRRNGEELTELQISVRERRDIYKNAIKEVRERGFSFSDGELLYCFSGLYERLGTLISVLRRFDKLFMAEKRRRASFSYNDIERFTYEALWQGGERTDTAISLREQFKCVYIDEYQDVNELQDKIFEAVSRDNNRFMVGDIKQSIYGFRGAEPDIFAKMKKTLPKYEEGSPYAALGLFMSENFRCDEGIVGCVNGVFDRIFGAVGDSIGYLPEDRLKYGKGAIQESSECGSVPTVTVVKRQTADEDGEAPHSPEARAVALKIRELLDNGRLNGGTPIRPRDIAIIMRKTQAKAKDYERELLSLGVPVNISGEKSFFLNREVLLALCLLNSIDNPRRDIYLSGLMRSPLYGFSADELLTVAGERCSSVYESLCKYTESHPGFERGARFLADIKRYRRIAESASTSALIYRLYRETGLLALASKNGVKDNLTLLLNYAREYEAKEYKGLYSFISFINELIANKTGFDNKRTASDADEVKIMTVHASKGLEYPVVFLAESASSLYPSAGLSPSNIRLQKGFGISFPLRTEGGLARVYGITDNAIADYSKERIFEEEMRVLYVGMTRARERLYIYGKAKEPSEYIEKMREYGELLTPYSVKRLSSTLDVICASRPTAAYEIYEGEEQDVKGTENSVSDLAESDIESAEDLASDLQESDIKSAEDLASGLQVSELNDASEAESLAKAKQSFLSRFTYEYPLQHLTRLPEKMSVSRLSPTVLDGTEEGAADASVLLKTVRTNSAGEADALNTKGAPSGTFEPQGESIEDGAKRTYPAFFTGKGADESAKRGIATHLFMQFCDLKSLASLGAAAELQRLTDGGFISEKDKERVRLREIELFLSSELFTKMTEAQRIYRELRFNVRMPSQMFTEDEQRRSLISDRKILVQGVIDCIIEQSDGGLLLVDYKTDRLTREEMADISSAARTLTEKHKTQLGYYAYAVKSIFGKEPDKVMIYSSPLGRCIEIKREEYLPFIE